MSTPLSRQMDQMADVQEWKERAEAAEAERDSAVQDWRNACALMNKAEAEVERLREALAGYDTLSLVIESAMRNEVGLDPRAAGHYERLCAVILQARAALRGER